MGIFNTSKYSHWYFNIIKQAENRTSTNGYFENHHIIPKSLGGEDIKKNLILLTPREHFICHVLLTKMTTGEAKKKMVYAARMMCVISNKHQPRHVNSRLYETLKQQYSQQLLGHPHFGPFKQSSESNKKRSAALKGTRVGSDNPFHGKKHSEENKKKWSEQRKGKPKSEETKRKMTIANKKNGLLRRGKKPPKLLCCGRLYDPGNLAKHRRSQHHMMNEQSNTNRNC